VLICKQLPRLWRRMPINPERSGQSKETWYKPGTQNNPNPSLGDLECLQYPPGLECLSADLCGSLGDISTRHPRYQRRTMMSGAKMLRAGIQTRWAIEYRCLHCGQGKHPCP